MLMFENGLLASFIPEILMVLGYLFCLFAPNIKEKPQPETNLVCILQISTLKSNSSNTLITNSFHSQQSASASVSNEKSKITSPTNTGSKFFYLDPLLLKGIRFSLFSRPTPTLYS
jgi:hypothetical protein